MVARPRVGVTSPSSMRSVVVLPAPFGPRKPVTWPGSTVAERSETAATVPNRLVSPVNSIGTPVGMAAPDWPATPALPPLSRMRRAKWAYRDRQHLPPPPEKKRRTDHGLEDRAARGAGVGH